MCIRDRQSRKKATEGAGATLGDTLGAETDVLVVVDPAELPRTYATVDILAEQVGDASYRVSAAAASAQRGARSGDGDESSTRSNLPADWGAAMREAAAGMRARVTFGDPHLDAKLFVLSLIHI